MKYLYECFLGAAQLGIYWMRKCLCLLQFA